MHYVQIISFATTDEFVTTDRLKRPALEFLNRMKGCLGCVAYLLSKPLNFLIGTMQCMVWMCRRRW